MSIFALGPFHNKEEEFKNARETLDKELRKFAWLKPASVKVFVGKFDPNALRFPYSLIPAMKNIPPYDERDWHAIQAWTAGVAEQIKA